MCEINNNECDCSGEQESDSNADNVLQKVRSTLEQVHLRLDICEKNRLDIQNEAENTIYNLRQRGVIEEEVNYRAHQTAVLEGQGEKRTEKVKAGNTERTTSSTQTQIISADGQPATDTSKQSANLNDLLVRKNTAGQSQISSVTSEDVVGGALCGSPGINNANKSPRAITPDERMQSCDAQTAGVDSDKSKIGEVTGDVTPPSKSRSLSKKESTYSVSELLDTVPPDLPTVPHLTDTVQRHRHSLGSIALDSESSPPSLMAGNSKLAVSLKKPYLRSRSDLVVSKITNSTSTLKEGVSPVVCSRL